VDPWQCTSEKGEESSGRKASCPDPVPDNAERGKNLANLSNQFAVSPNHRFEVHEHGQLFVGIHELLFLVAMLVRNPDLEKPRLLPTESFLSDPSDDLIADDF
jgi:hypothetical protein